jgi:hypothetical protein
MSHYCTHLMQTVEIAFHTLDSELLPSVDILSANDFAEGPLTLFAN